MSESILRLKVNSEEYNNKLKQAVNELLRMETECRKVNGTLGVLEKEQLEYVKSLGQMETASKTAKGKVKELSNAYLNFALIYKRMSDEEKRDEGGKALANSLTQLKGRLNDAKKELAEVESEMKGASSAGIDFNSVLASLGQRFGINSELMSVLSSGTLATTAAVTAGAAAVAAATKMWADYNDELNRQTNVTTVTTGLKGDDAENLTIGVRALARTYDVDFREAINAANTLIQQFGVSGEQALSLLQDGMQGMIAGDGGKLLSMIQQYAPSFRDAGIEASQLVAVIQNSEGGLFTDQNMQAIVMGIRNIRLMTKQTSDALAQLGIDGQEMSRKLEDGSMTIFDALRQVSGAIDNVGSGSKAAGEVMQAVFGRQGTMAGTKLGEAIATLNTNLEETKMQTGELGQSFVRLNDANMRLEETMRELFGMTGWEDMSNTIKTEFASSLSDAMDYLINVRDALYNIGTSDSFDTLADAAMRFAPALWPILKGLSMFSGMLEDIKQRWNGLFGGGEGQDGDNGTFKGIGSRLRQTAQNAIQAAGLPMNMLEEVVVTPSSSKKNQNKGGGGGGGGGKTAPTWAPIEMQALGGLSFGRSVNDVQADISKAQKAYNNAEDAAGRAAAQTILDKRNAELTDIKNEGNLFADAYAYNFERDKVAEKNDDKEEKEKEDKQAVKMTDVLDDVSGGIGQMIGGLEQLGVDIPEGLKSVVSGITTVTSILSAIATIVMAIQAISAADTIIPFAHGGLVGKAAGGMLIPGNNFSGDNLRMPLMGGRGMIGVNSGELILNRSQQDSIAQQLSVDTGRTATSQPYVSGEMVYLAVNNFLRRSGKGEILTAKN